MGARAWTIDDCHSHYAMTDLARLPLRNTLGGVMMFSFSIEVHRVVGCCL